MFQQNCPKSRPGTITEKTRTFIKEEKRGRRALIALLQKIQNEYNHLPQEALRELALGLNIPLSEVYSVATFYKAFTFKPRGRHLVTVCLGTACHVRGARKAAEEAEKILGVPIGETTSDGEHTLDTVNCLGACALGPIVVLDKTYHGQMTPQKVRKLFKK